jgi:outer membrane immunogenic protein
MRVLQRPDVELTRQELRFRARDQAYAADLGPYRAPPPEREYYEPVRDMPWSWRGFYGGVNAGYGWGGDDTVTLSGPGIGTAIGSLEPNGWFGGGQIGYNAQFQSLVFGLEADIQGADISDGISGPVPGTAYFATAETTVDWFSTVRGRVGYAADLRCSTPPAVSRSATSTRM